MKKLESHIAATLATLVVGASVTTIVKLVRTAFGASALPKQKANAAVRTACEAMVERGELIEQERGHTYYVMEPRAALEVLRAFDAAASFDLMRAVGETLERTSLGGPHWWMQARIAVASGEPMAILRACVEGSRCEYYTDAEAEGWLQVVGDVPPPGLLEHLAEPVAAEYCAQSFAHARRAWTPIAPEVLTRLSAGPAKMKRTLAGYLALRGDYVQARTLAGSNKETQAGLEVVQRFFDGALREAATLGLDACAALKRKSKVLTAEAGVLHTLACIASSSADPRCMPHAQAAVLAGMSRSRFYEGCYLDLAHLVDPDASNRAFYRRSSEPAGGLDACVRVLSALWSRDGAAEPPELPVQWMAWRRNVQDVPQLRALMDELDDACAEPAAATGLAGAFVPRAAWELALDALEVTIKGIADASASSDGKESIVWIMAGRPDDLRIECRLRGPRSRKGRAVSLLTVMKKAGADEISVTAQDQDVLDACVVERDEWTGRKFGLFTARAVAALAGHPRVEDEEGRSLSVVREQARLVFETTDEGATLTITPRRLVSSHLALVRRDDEVTVYERPAAWKPLLDEFRGAKLEVPPAGAARLEQLAAALSEQGSFAVEGLSLEGGLQDADPRILARLIWDGHVLLVELRSAPFGADGPHYPVGEGSRDAVRPGPDGLVGARRDLDDELRRAGALRAVLPGEWMDGSDRIIDDLEEALGVIEILEGLGESIQRAWPAKQLRVRSGSGSADSLRVKVQKSDAWFRADPSLQVDASLVLSFKALLAGREGSGRYVKLGEDEYVALSADIARRLDALRAFASGDVVRLHPAAAESLGLTEDAPGVQLDADAKARLAAFSKARTLRPRLPRSFRAQLRTYQREGFVWLARLCAAGLGGCLADDMGLGKTIQSLALLCLRAKEGPALVVCPTSVVANWMDECARFAPKLRVRTLGPSDRGETIAGLGAGDVLITSYGLLVREREALAEPCFGTAIFDEAHALKTATSQRAKAAFAIDAKARVTLTGTPIENHLGELWSVMNAAVPGLLGSKRQFDDRLGRPVLRGHPGALDRLRGILDPFVLRRRRAEVLSELPELTEITVHVPPTDAQAAYYEVIRRRAAEALEKAREDPARARLQVLAEITRLRQAAVDPRLLDGDVAPAGAKLDEACERIAALHDDGHRCLVFTQFLGCLTRLEERLGELGLDVLTLDGSTPAALRKARIDAFQRGEADAFVMSLKAGGVGINLTAAQYVIHMDPWWNPAVEEQATARSHRMGQRDPVTVYRLITEGSIEEQILDLHALKRGLAEDLLGGMDQAKGLDLDALAKMIG